MLYIITVLTFLRHLLPSNITPQHEIIFVAFTRRCLMILSARV